MDGRQGFDFDKKPGDANSGRPNNSGQQGSGGQQSNSGRQSSSGHQSVGGQQSNSGRQSSSGHQSIGGRSGNAGSISQSFSSKKTDEVEFHDGFRIGDTIGGTYFILSHLGRGGMGEVFGVEHIMLRQTYALKILTTDSPSDINWRRFQTEARTIAKLNHPNIIKVHNLGIHNEKVPYYVMELLEGETLSAVVKREGPLDPLAVIDLFLPLCEGLAYAHGNGVVHRDIKPSNIMLVTLNGKTVPKLVDFGLVKLVAGGALSPSQQLTTTGEVFGSPLYMSPEQSVGRHINERSDIYSLGCTMFEALTGAPPFVGENVVQTILKHQNEEPPTLKQASMGAQFSPEWEAVMARLLVKEASERYQSMSEVAHDLLAIKNGKKVSAKYATTGDGDLFEDAAGGGDGKKSAFSNGQLLIFCSSILALLTVCIGVGGYIYIKQQERTKPAHVDTLGYSGIKPEQPLNPVLDKDLEDISIPFVQNGGKPIGGFKIYKFPQNISLGEMVVSSINQPKPLVLDAQGEINIPVDGKVTFNAAPECGIHPKIFRKFTADDLEAVQLPGTASDTDDELHYLSHLTNIAILNLEDTDVTGAGIEIIGEMPRLTNLRVSRTKKLSGEDLAKLKSLTRLTDLDFNQGTNLTPVLEALKGSTNMLNIALDHTKLTADDVKLLATMPNLQSISLTGCNLTAEDLAPLGNLKGLARLLLRDNNLSPKFIDIFKDSKALGWVEISPPPWSEADLARLQATFGPRCGIRKPAKID